ncbi:MAG: hypothetical protein EBT44_04960, partial [Actinobacteria bacterium]|nr:hypothetical protein [Candidatus Fonsibacter lacus]
AKRSGVSTIAHPYDERSYLSLRNGLMAPFRLDGGLQSEPGKVLFRLTGVNATADALPRYDHAN